MSKRKVDPQLYVTLREQGHNNTEIAERFGVSEASVRRGLKAANFNPNKLPLSLMEDFAAELDTPLVHEVTRSGIVVTADWHHPLTDYALVNQLLDHASDIGARHLVVAGDWWHMDALSSFESKQDNANLKTELKYSGAAMQRVGEFFDQIYFTWGNHDNRFVKVLQYALSFKHAMRMLFEEVAPDVVKKITFSNLDYMIIETPNGPYRVSHPKSYSAVPLANPRRQASKFLMHALSGHTHHFALGYDVSGQYIAAELGGLHRKEATQYLQRTTNYPNWNQGYAIIDSQGNLHMEGEGVSFGALARRAA